MKRKLLGAAVALALGWAGGSLYADEPASGPVSGSVLTNTGTSSMPELGCCEPGHGHFVGSAALYFLQPAFQSNPAYGIASIHRTAPTGPVTISETIEQHDFSYGTDGAPEIFVGYVSASGLGAGVRYFNYDHSSAVHAIAPENTTTDQFALLPAGSFTAFGSIFFGSGVSELDSHSNLHVSVIDFQVTQDWRPGCWILTGGAGVRYAHMSQEYFSTVTGSGIVPAQGADEAFATISGSHNFNGAGPLVVLDAKRFLGSSGLALYGNTRGAVLFGTTKQSLTLAFPEQEFEGLSTFSTTSRQTDVLPVVEMEVGAEFGHNLGRARVFAQLGFVGQVWFGGGNATQTTSILQFGNDNNTNFGFVGGVIRAGVDF